MRAPRIAAVATYLLTMVLGVPPPATASPAVDDLKKLGERAQKSAEVLSAIMSAPEHGIPESLLRRAVCVAVIPKVVKVGLGFGGRRGKGLVSCRASRSWSQPSFVVLTGGSFGLQIGFQATDFVLVFVNESAARRLLSEKFTLGADASVSAGPVGRTAELGTDVTLESEIFAYSRSRGLFVGISIEGAKLGIDERANRTVYGRDVDREELLFRGLSSTPDPVAPFVEVLRAHAPLGEAG